MDHSSQNEHRRDDLAHECSDGAINLPCRISKFAGLSTGRAVMRLLYALAHGGTRYMLVWRITARRVDGRAKTQCDDA